MKSQAETRHADLLWGMEPGHSFAWANAVSTLTERFPGEHMVIHSDGCRVLLSGCTCHPVIVMPSSRVA